MCGPGCPSAVLVDGHGTDHTYGFICKRTHHHKRVLQKATQWKHKKVKFKTLALRLQNLMTKKWTILSLLNRQKMHKLKGAKDAATKVTTK